MSSELIISAVYKRRPLWDTRHIEHGNRGVINALWDEVAQEVGVPKVFVKAKWRGLRDYYRQVLKKPSGQLADLKWIYLDQISFLKDAMTFRTNGDNGSDTSKMKYDNMDGTFDENDDDYQTLHPEVEVGDDSYYDTDNETKFDVSNIFNSAPSTSQPEEFLTTELHEGKVFAEPSKMNESSSRGLKRLNADIDFAGGSESDKRKSKHIKDMKEDDDDLYFFKSLLPDLKNLPRARKAYIRLKIQELILNEVYSQETSNKTTTGQDTVPSPGSTT